jgi:TrmH family RNA methyltransferase
MGAAFRLPVVSATIDETLALGRERGIPLIATGPRGGRLLYETDLRHPVIIAVGGEGPGLPAQLLSAADAIVTIPMSGRAESLNVAIATALLVYEARRQRQG